MTYLVQNVVGKGVHFANVSSVFNAQLATVVGGVYLLAEDVDTPDVATITTPNSGSETGSLANTLAIAAAIDGGVSESPPVLPTYVVAAEVAAVGAPFRGYIEAYYIDMLVANASTALAARRPLYPTTSENFSQSAPAIGSPIHGRLLRSMASDGGTPALAKGHFIGKAGGFGIGPGA